MTDTQQVFGGYDDDVDTDNSYTPDEPENAGSSLFDELREDSKKDLDNIIHLSVRQREGWNVQFNAIISNDDIKRYENASQGKRKKAENADRVKMSAMPLLEKCTGIFKNGTQSQHQVHAPNGKPLRLNSNDFLALQGHPKDAIKALQAFMGDAGIMTMGAALLEEAGWTEDLEPLDPTEGSDDG